MLGVYSFRTIITDKAVRLIIYNFINIKKHPHKVDYLSFVTKIVRIGCNYVLISYCKVNILFIYYNFMLFLIDVDFQCVGKYQGEKSIKSISDYISIHFFDELFTFGILTSGFRLNYE